MGKYLEQVNTMLDGVTRTSSMVDTQSLHTQKNILAMLGVIADLLDEIKDKLTE